MQAIKQIDSHMGRIDCGHEPVQLFVLPTSLLSPGPRERRTHGAGTSLPSLAPMQHREGACSLSVSVCVSRIQGYHARAHVQYCTVQYSTVHYSTVHYSTVQCDVRDEDGHGWLMGHS